MILSKRIVNTLCALLLGPRQHARIAAAAAPMNSVDLTPHPAFLIESLRNIGYSLETALADIIDNSITAEAGQISVRFMWSAGTPWIAVCDDGHGMPRDRLHEAMRFGSSSPLAKRSPQDLGRFGLGMKTASLSQCRAVTVVSKSSGEAHACIWDLDLLAERNKPEWRASIPQPSELAADPVAGPLLAELQKRTSGTFVLWERLDVVLSDAAGAGSEQRFSALMDQARTHVQTVFHRFLSAEGGRRAVRMDFNGSSLAAFDPFGPRHPARQELPLETVIVTGECVEVQPYVLPHHTKIARADYELFGGDDGYLQNQGFYVYRNRRLIVKGTWFRLIRKAELNKLVRVRVDIPNTLDHLWRIDIRKSQADPPETVLQELRRIIHRIAGTGQRVYTNRALKLQQRDKVSVWRREVVDSLVRYVLNQEHPLIRSLFEDEDESRRARNRACLQLISASFPAEMYFSDAADDSVEFAPVADEAQVIEMVRRLIETMRSIGLNGDDLRRHLMKTEVPALSPELIERLLAEPHGRSS